MYGPINAFNKRAMASDQREESSGIFFTHISQENPANEIVSPLP
jgi:hypothetical protein